jgi:hypothetical protein
MRRLAGYLLDPAFNILLVDRGEMLARCWWQLAYRSRTLHIDCNS